MSYSLLVSVSMPRVKLQTLVQFLLNKITLILKKQTGVLFVQFVTWHKRIVNLKFLKLYCLYAGGNTRCGVCPESKA